MDSMYSPNLITLLLHLCLLLIGAGGKRNISNYDCYCGLKVQGQDRSIITHPWTIHVHVTGGSPEATNSCIGTVIASNVILTSRNCLTKKGTTSLHDLASIVVSNNARKGEGNLTYSVVGLLQNQSCPGWKNIVGLKVGHDFTSKASQHKPVCIPAPEERPKVTVSEGLNVTIETVGAGVISGLVVKRGQDCDVGGELKLGSGGIKENVLCVTVTDGKAELEEGQPIFMEVAKNPYASYPYGVFTYLVGITALVREGIDGQRHLFFAPANSFLEKIEETENTPEDIRWCPQPWAWLNAPEVTRDESLDCECGIRKEGAQGRVIGGEDATPYEFPWMAKFYIDKGGEFEGPCGGALISDRVILTAAHCLVDDGQIIVARLGYNVFDYGKNIYFQVALHAHKRMNDSLEILVEPKLVLVHPGYVDGRRKSIAEQDLALVILTTPVNFSQVGAKDGKPLISPVCLPKLGERINLAGMRAVLAGWGIMQTPEGNVTLADELQKVSFTLPPFQECTDPFKGKAKTFNALVCGGVNRPGGPRLGDSGGPLVVPSSQEKYTQVGVVGFGSIILGGQGLIRNATHVTFYHDLQELVNWVEYQSSLYGARYCKK